MSVLEDKGSDVLHLFILSQTTKLSGSLAHKLLNVLFLLAFKDEGFLGLYKIEKDVGFGLLLYVIKRCLYPILFFCVFMFWRFLLIKARSWMVFGSFSSFETVIFICQLFKFEASLSYDKSQILYLDRRGVTSEVREVFSMRLKE